MEIHTQTHYNPSSPTAPTSPSRHARNPTVELYYSAPTSPHMGSGQIPDFDFEFETSKNFSYFESSPEFFNSQRFDDRFIKKQKPAEELFVDGLVVAPLKLPPRLQRDGYSSSFSPILSPKSPTTLCRLPFPRKNSSWNDYFDPFAAALEKVREEKRGRNNSITITTTNDRQRSRSYSPFRWVGSCSNVDFSNQDMHKEENPEKKVEEPARNLSGPLDFKGSVYARWVRDQAQRRGTLGQHRELKSPRMLSFLTKKVRPLRNEHEGLDKFSSVGEKRGKMKKLKDVLIRYALLRKENKGSKKTIKG